MVSTYSETIGLVYIPFPIGKSFHDVTEYRRYQQWKLVSGKGRDYNADQRIRRNF
jgi:hypothetical protein